MVVAEVLKLATTAQDLVAHCNGEDAHNAVRTVPGDQVMVDYEVTEILSG